MNQYCLSALSFLDPMLRRSQSMMIACDFDGTLCPIAETPSDVHVAPNMLGVLRLIANSPSMKLAIVSGRAIEDVARRIPVDAVFAGNHGLQIRGGGIEYEHEHARQVRPQLERCCRELREILKPWSGAWIEDKHLSATVHFRAVDPREHEALRRAVRRSIAGRSRSIGLRAASKALELYPKIGWHKGDAVSYIKQQCGPFDTCVCLGDDYTDENMFEAAPGNINIRVGQNRPTKASLYLNDPSDVAIFLQHLWDIDESKADMQSVATAASGPRACPSTGDVTGQKSTGLFS
jgi:trehalose 6-phosphate phosphatase